MFIEIRKVGKKDKYYLTHSYRKVGKNYKIRRYLGENLSQNKLNNLLPQAKNAINIQISEIKKEQNIKDPYSRPLPLKEIEKINKVILNSEFKSYQFNEKEWEKFTESFTYNTNAIEGSTLIASEVRKILSSNLWPHDAPKEDIAEAQGVKEALKFIKKTKDHISIELIKKIHHIVFKNSKSFAGKTRKKGVEVVVGDRFGNIVHKGAKSTRVINLLKKLVEWYNKNKNKFHPLILAAVIHNQFETIHPFADGNGRVGRILLNNILLRHKFPPIDIELKNRQEYYHSLREYQHKGNLEPSIKLLLKEHRIFERKMKAR
jgi:Fic family protein